MAAFFRPAGAYLLAITTCLLFPVPSVAVEPPPARDMAFVDVNVITMAGPRVLEGQTVLVRDGRIAAMGPVNDIALAGDMARVDGTGRYLMPGLAEMHAHIPEPAPEGLPAGYREDVFFLWVANGVTLARGMLGHPSHLALRDRVHNHRVLGPRLHLAGPSFSGASVDDSQEAVARVRAQQEAGYDLVKIHPGPSREQFDAIAAEANRIGMPFAGHVPLAVGLERALAKGMATVDHLDGYIHALVPDLEAQPAQRRQSLFGAALVSAVDEGRIDGVVTKTRAAGAWVVPTETLLENIAADREQLRGRPENAYLPPALLKRYLERVDRFADMAGGADMTDFLALRKRLQKALHDGGVGILLGADSPQVFNVPGFSIHRELAASVAAGLSPYEALLTGTRNPARHLGAEEDFGTIAVGREADLVLLAANPLEDIANTREIQGVMVRGRWLPRDFLDTELARIRAAYESR